MTYQFEERLTALEIKSAYQEDTINQLDQIIIRQQGQIDLLRRQVDSLIDHVREMKQPSQQTTPTAEQERPPHY